MKKLNTTYLDNLVSKILKETLEEKEDSLVSKFNGKIVRACSFAKRGSIFLLHEAVEKIYV